MTEPTTGIDFFVYLVESPSAPDLYHDRSERDLLDHALRLAQVPCVSHCAISREAFCAALEIGLKDAISRFQPKLPLLHLSSHGDPNGIQLSSGEMITWEELGELLVPVNEALNGRLVVLMSCCEGYCGIRMAMRDDEKPLPYFALVGSSQKPRWSETAIGYAVFYHRLTQGAHINDAVAAMNVGAGCNHFHVEWAENSKKFYAEFLQAYNPALAQQQLVASATVRQAADLQKKGISLLPLLDCAA